MTPALPSPAPMHQRSASHGPDGLEQPGMAGDRELKGRAAPRCAFEVDLAAVELDEGLDQAEAEADPPLAELEVARGVMHRVEAGEERLRKGGAGRAPGGHGPLGGPG